MYRCVLLLLLSVVISTPTHFLFVFSLCSKLDMSTDFKSVAAKEKLNSYKVGEEITCFVSKVR